MPLKVAIVGTGNVGFHLAKHLAKAKSISLSHIISREVFKAKSLGNEIQVQNCQFVALDNLSDVQCDIVILSVPDQKIAEVIQVINLPENTVVVHTAGSQPISLLQKFKRFGVLYPFQTFTKKQEINFSEIPIFMEGSDETTLKVIETVSLSLSPKVKLVHSENRQKIHLAAVFACNFTNHLYAIAEEILSEANVELADMEHLMQETVSKAIGIGARKAQTGPAVRGDQSIIDKHMNLLSNATDKQTIYKLLSEQITSLRD